MTNEATNTDHTATGHSCAHCDSTEDHHALDEKGIVDSFRSALRGSSAVRSVLAAAALVLGIIWSPLSVLAGAGAWAVATFAGVLVVSGSRRKYGIANSLVLGTIASAGIMPILAWLVAAGIGASVMAALAGAAGWLAAVAVVEFIRDRKLAELLIEDSRDAEAARSGVLFSKPVSPWVGLGWSISTAIFFGLWIWVTGLLPLAVIPLVPLQVALALLSRKGNLPT